MVAERGVRVEKGVESTRLDLRWWRAGELPILFAAVPVLLLSFAAVIPQGVLGILALGGILAIASSAFRASLTVEADREGVTVHRWLSPLRQYPWGEIVAVNVKMKRTWANWNLMREYTYYCCELVLEGRPAARLYAGDVSCSRRDAELVKELIDEGRKRWVW